MEKKLIHIKETPLYINKETLLQSLYEYFGDITNCHTYIGNLYNNGHCIMLVGDDYYGEEDSVVTEDPDMIKLFNAIKILQECI